MPFHLRANNKLYLVLDHAALRMLIRYITEEMIIETIEHGEIIDQPHGTEVYEYSYQDEESGIIVIRVIVDEANRHIVTVFDDTDARD